MKLRPARYNAANGVCTEISPLLKRHIPTPVARVGRLGAVEVRSLRMREQYMCGSGRTVAALSPLATLDTIGDRRESDAIARTSYTGINSCNRNPLLPSPAQDLVTLSCPRILQPTGYCSDALQQR